MGNGKDEGLVDDRTTVAEPSRFRGAPCTPEEPSRNRHGGRRVAGTERDLRDESKGDRYRPPPGTNGAGESRRKVQGSGRSASPGLCLRDVADRLRRA